MLNLLLKMQALRVSGDTLYTGEWHNEVTRNTDLRKYGLLLVM